MIPFDEVLQRLKRLDEITLLELLDISSEELVDRFEDLIEQDYEFYAEQVQETTDFLT